MTPATFRTLQRRARRQERARQWPEPRLFVLTVLLLGGLYAVFVLLVAWLWFP